MKPKLLNLIATLLLGSLLIIVSGCGGGPDSDSMIAEMNDTNAKRLANLYAFFQMSNEWNGPKDEAEFKEFIRAQSSKRLERAGISIDELDGLFVSERDNKPFKIRWGMTGRVRGPSLPVVFEAEGVDGVRQVGFTGSPMQEVDATEYDRLWKSEPDSLPNENERNEQQ